MTDDAKAVADRIIDFLRGIGIDVREDALPDDTFLPGLRVASGGLVVDRTKLLWPGDLLHEAGHIAVTPSSSRPLLSDALHAHVEAPHAGEVEATAWAYAATVALNLDPALLFHAGGYRGASPGLILTYTMGVYPGCHGLSEADMTRVGEAARVQGVEPYPAMMRWLRE